MVIGNPCHPTRNAKIIYDYIPHTQTFKKWLPLISILLLKNVLVKGNILKTYLSKLLMISSERLTEKGKIPLMLQEFEKAKKHQNEATKASANNSIKILVFSFLHNFVVIL